jgi:uncharacterized protein (TIGR00299 family) protein
MATLYIEPFGGMAGDMLLAALCDLGDPRFGLADLEALVRELVPGECVLSLERAWRGNLSGALLDVRTDESADPPHRHHADLVLLLGRAHSLSDAARARAGRVLWRIAEAEARVHGTTPDEIHFHEVGAVDTLVDVAGAALALERLGVTRVVAHAPLAGGGTVDCAHGRMPVPTPAVAELLRGRAMTIGGEGERLTPTGAALLAELVPEFGTPGGFRAERVGYGAGHRDPETGPPNLVRVQLGELVDAEDAGGLALVPAWQLEVQLDDVTGEELGLALEALRDAGALDVWAVPVQMKKGRPGTLVCALCRDEDRERLAACVFATTPTLGLRFVRVERVECARGTLTVELDGAPVRVKVRERPALVDGLRGGLLGGNALDERDLSPEHDDLAALAAATGASLRALERRAIAAALDALARGARPS